MAPPIIVGTLFVWYTSLYSDYMDRSQTSISGGISLAEILSGIGVYVLFASAWLSTYRIDWKTIGMAFILGIWLVGIGNIFNLGFSDKTQALLEKRSSYQTHVSEIILSLVSITYETPKFAQKTLLYHGMPARNQSSGTNCLNQPSMVILSR